MTIPLFIPYVNRPDLGERAALSVLGTGVSIKVIDNSGQTLIAQKDAPEGIMTPPVPLTFAQSQNWMLRMAEEQGNPFYLFMHSDAEAGEGTVQKLIELAWSLTNEGRKWGVIFTNYDALAVFNTAAFREVGGWDVHLPWYFADNSMYRKLCLAGYELIKSNLPVKHEPSQTIKSDPFLNHVNGITFPIYAEYYRQCWGGSPGNETFTVPFNGVFACEVSTLAEEAASNVGERMNIELSDAEAEKVSMPGKMLPAWVYERNPTLEDLVDPPKVTKMERLTDAKS